MDDDHLILIDNVPDSPLAAYETREDGYDRLEEKAALEAAEC